MSPAATIAGRTAPFIGLHYFDDSNEDLFFGRDEQVSDLLAKLADSRFVTVIGSSGTGKSSLARAGLIPALRAGFLAAAGSNWQIVKTRPGDSPIRNLAEKMEKVFAGSSGVETTLRRGPLGLIEAASQCALSEAANLLIVVDQFEEIFRYQRETRSRSATGEAAAFVKLLLEATAQVHPNIFVLVTMRSDYLGACAQFRDLPERINTGLYLIPRMRREQMEEAITGPAAVAGARFSPPLVQRLLNDAGDDPDQLPVLQHALLRTWLTWKADNDPAAEIDFRHYEKTGGVLMALHGHAEEIYGDLSPEQQRVTQAIFRCLTERDPSNNDIRRPTPLNNIADAAGVSTEAVEEIAGRFLNDDVSFLTLWAPATPNARPSLDITHESLIRKWLRLGGGGEFKGWVQQEAEDREDYRDLVKWARMALLHGDVLTGTALDKALEWRSREPGPGWGARYERSPGAHQLVTDYIDRSRNARQTEMAERIWQGHWRRASAIVTVLVLLGISISVFYKTQAGGSNIHAPAVPGKIDKDAGHDATSVIMKDGIEAAKNELTGAPRNFINSIADAPKGVKNELTGAPRNFINSIADAPKGVKSNLNDFLPTCLLFFCYATFVLFGEDALRSVFVPRILKKIAATATATSRDGSPVVRDITILETTPAGFVRRLSGYLIDLGVCFVVLLGWSALDDFASATDRGWIAAGTAWFLLAGILTDWLLEAFTLSSRWQATLGMKLAHNLVTDLRGNRISFGRATARYFAKGLTWVSLIGLFFPLLTRRKQTLHDLIAGTLVTTKRRVATPPPPAMPPPAPPMPRIRITVD